MHQATSTTYPPHSPGQTNMLSFAFAPAAHQPAIDHYLKVQAAARTLAALLSPFVPAQRIVVCRIDGKKESVVIDSNVPAIQAVAKSTSFVPTQAEEKLIRLLGLGDKMGKQCSEHMNGHFYGSRGVKKSLTEAGIVEQRADQRYGLTEAGEEVFADLTDMDSDVAEGK